MKKNCLANTNPHLKGSNRRALAERSVASSCGVEGVKADLNAKLDIVIPRRPKNIYKSVS